MLLLFCFAFLVYVKGDACQGNPKDVSPPLLKTIVMPVYKDEQSNHQQAEYANAVWQQCLQSGLRTEVNNKSERIGQKIREAEVQKTPYILIVGKKEVENSTVAVRKHGKGDIGAMQLKDFLNVIKEELGGDN